MASIDIEDTDISASKLPSEVDESVKMNVSILVMLSSNNALCSESRKVVDNIERVERIALRIRKQAVSELESDRHVGHVIRGSIENWSSWEYNINLPAGPGPGSLYINGHVCNQFYIIMFRRRFSRRRRVFRRRTSNRVVRPRASVRRRRFTRRRTFVSRRRILNVSSEKKHDDMINTVVNDLGQHVIFQLIITAPATFLFLASARPTYSLTSTKDFTRQSRDTFCRGYGETIMIDVENPQEWYWRRIVFTFVGDIFLGTGTGASTSFNDDAVAGMTRHWNQMTNPQTNAIESVIFQGKAGVDWFDQRTAKTDPRRISVIRDQFRHLKASIGQAYSHRFRNYYPVNRRLIYNDEEVGKDDDRGVLNYVSAQDPQSVGDVYVYDLFFNTIGDIPQTFRVVAEGRYYWRER